MWKKYLSKQSGNFGQNVPFLFERKLENFQLNPKEGPTKFRMQFKLILILKSWP